MMSEDGQLQSSSVWRKRLAARLQDGEDPHDLFIVICRALWETKNANSSQQVFELLHGCNFNALCKPRHFILQGEFLQVMTHYAHRAADPKMCTRIAGLPGMLVQCFSVRIPSAFILLLTFLL